jgi:HK97 family phage major capsid protein
VLAQGNKMHALEIARAHAKEWSDTPEVELELKAAVAGGTTTDTTWAGPLVVATNIASEFAEFLRPLTIIGRIPGLTRVPFNISVPRATSGTTSSWVGEAAPKPLTTMTFDSITLRFAKIASIVVISEELARFSNPAAEAVISRDLTRGVIGFMDRSFVDPSLAAVTNVSPASITNGVTPVTATGTTSTAARTDFATLLNLFLSNNLSLADSVWVMTQQQASNLSLMLNALGQPLFPTMGATGGTLMGLPAIASENIPATGGSPADGYPIILLKASEILLADDGGVNIDVSREAVVQLDTTPDSPPIGTTVYTSLWQTNQLGIKAELFVTWAKRRATAVQFIQNAKYIG